MTGIRRDADPTVREGGLPAVPAAGFNPPTFQPAGIAPMQGSWLSSPMPRRQSAKADFVPLLPRCRDFNRPAPLDPASRYT